VSVVSGALIAILLAIAALHLYWGFGGLWPGSDSNSLRDTVVGAARGPMYGLVACAMVAGALGAAAAVVVARHSALMNSPLRLVILAGYVVLILIFAARGIAPYVSPVFEYARGRPFFELNLWVYAPLCLAIAALFVIDFPRTR
jgi:Protein of unknown function (DUF3995)